MKRFAVFVAIFVSLASLSYGQNINKTRYKEISPADYLAAGAVQGRTDTELFKMDFTFVLQIANSVAVKDADNALHRFVSEKELQFKPEDKIVLYVHSTHSEEGDWETATIDLAEPKTGS